MPHDVFISYSTRDKATADAVCHALEAEGIRCWIAPRDALPGRKYQGSIVRAIRECRAMVLVFSGGANDSEHVTREVSIASDHGKPVVPFRIEAVEMSDDLYYYISSVHWLDALTPPLEHHVERLVEAVLGLLPGARPRERSQSSAAAGLVTATAGASRELETYAATAPVEVPSRQPPPDGDRSAPVTPEGRFSLAYTLKGYDESPVHSMAFSPDGAHLATGGKGGVTFWDVASRRKLGRHGGSVRAVAFSPNGKWVAYGERTGTVLYDVHGHRSVRLGWKALLGGALNRRGPIVAFSPDGQLLAVGEVVGVVSVWDVDTARVSFRLERHSGGAIFPTGIVSSIAFSPDGRLLASAGHGGIWLWTAREGRELRSFDDVDPMDALSLVFSPDSRLLACLGQDGQIRILDPNGRTETRILNPDGLEAVRNPQELLDAAGGGLAFHPSGSLIASARERAIDIWDPVTGMPVWSYPQTAMVSCVAFSPDGGTLASGGYDGKVRSWSVGEGG